MADDESELEEQGGGRFPFIPLQRAIERTRQLHASAGKHAVPVSDLHKLWEYSAKASGWKQTLSALKYYGLIETTGVKENRLVKLTEDARRYFLDERPEKHAEARRSFALKPQALAKLWQLWRDEPPADAVARSTLKVQFGYGENAAAEILTIYKANILFADLASDSPNSGQPSDRDRVPGASPEAAPLERSGQAEPERHNPAHSASPAHTGKVRLMEGERVVFTEEGQPNQYLKLVASGDFDDTLLEALEDFVKRQRKRLGRQSGKAAQHEEE